MHTLCRRSYRGQNLGAVSTWSYSLCATSLPSPLRHRNFLTALHRTASLCFTWLAGDSTTDGGVGPGRGGGPGKGKHKTFHLHDDALCRRAKQSCPPVIGGTFPAGVAETRLTRDVSLRDLFCPQMSLPKYKAAASAIVWLMICPTRPLPPPTLPYENREEGTQENSHRSGVIRMLGPVVEPTSAAHRLAGGPLSGQVRLTVGKEGSAAGRSRFTVGGCLACSGCRICRCVSTRITNTSQCDADEKAGVDRWGIAW